MDLSDPLSVFLLYVKLITIRVSILGRKHLKKSRSHNDICSLNPRNGLCTYRMIPNLEALMKSMRCSISSLMGT